MYEKLEMQEAYDEVSIKNMLHYLPKRYVNTEEEILDAIIRYAVHLECNDITPDEAVKQSQCVLNLTSALEILMRVEKNVFLDPLLTKIATE